MVQDQGIDVYLAPYSDITKRYPEHTIPDTSPVFSGNANEVYIEAVDGERFIIVVDLLEDFDAKGSKRLKTEYIIDGGGSTGNSSYPELAKRTRKRARLQGREVVENEVKKIDGRWVDCGYTFAQLKMDEEMDMDADQVATRVEMHGKIKVNIRRGEYIPANTKHSQSSLWNGYEPPDTRISSKAVVKDNHVSHAVRHVVLEDAAQPSCELKGGMAWKRHTGEGGNTISFTIRYRSHDALQKLKIIPKDIMRIDLTDSPPPSPKVKLEGVSSIKRERTKDSRGEGDIKQEATDESSSGDTNPPPSIAAQIGASDGPSPSTEQYERKRKAVQDELKGVELEEQRVALAQKRLRLQKALTEMEDNGK